MFKRAAQIALIMTTVLPCTIAAEYRKEGNLALPITQMPGPLFSLGQTIIEEHEVAIAVMPYRFQGETPRTDSTLLDTHFYYGATKELTLVAHFPVFIESQAADHSKSSGLGDIILQGEYAFYTTEAETFLTQATVVGAVTFPTGSTTKTPALGLGSMSFLLGATYSYLAIDWYAFISGGALLTTPHHHEKMGNVYYYECGLGHNLFNPNGWLIMGMIECNGIYKQRDTVFCKKDPNSGGNIILVGPVLYAASDHLSIEAGIQWPVLQQLRGIQNKIDFRATLLVAWRF